MRFTSLAGLAFAALLTPVAAKDFDAVEVETSDYDGDQPASMLLWQTVSVDWEGEVDVRHFSAFHSKRFRGVASAEELAALERAVRGARLGEGVPATFSAAPWGDTFKVEGGPSALNGETKGEVERGGAFEARFEPLRAVALRIAERLVHPPALPAGQVQGWVEVRGYTTYLNLGSNRRYEVRPRELADQLEALDGERIVVEGSLSGSSNYSRRVEVAALVEPALAELHGSVDAQAATLTLGERTVPLSFDEDLAEVFARLNGAVTLRGFVRQGPRGPRSMHVQGLRAVLTEDSWPLDAGDEVVITEHRWGDSFRVMRLTDGDEGSADLAELELRSAPATAGLSAALGQ